MIKFSPPTAIGLLEQSANPDTLRRASEIRRQLVKALRHLPTVAICEAARQFSPGMDTDSAIEALSAEIESFLSGANEYSRLAQTVMDVERARLAPLVAGAIDQAFRDDLRLLELASLKKNGQRARDEKAEALLKAGLDASQIANLAPMFDVSAIDAEIEAVTRQQSQLSRFVGTSLERHLPDGFVPVPRVKVVIPKECYER